VREERFTLERRVDLELLKLFMRYQIDLRILTQIGKQTGTETREDTQHSRGERGDTNTSTDKQYRLVL
jgi:hypothetical protein